MYIYELYPHRLSLAVCVELDDARANARSARSRAPPDVNASRYASRRALEIGAIHVQRDAARGGSLIDQGYTTGSAGCRAALPSSTSSIHSRHDHSSSPCGVCRSDSAPPIPRRRAPSRK